MFAQTNKKVFKSALIIIHMYSTFNYRYKKLASTNKETSLLYLFCYLSGKVVHFFFIKILTTQQLNAIYLCKYTVQHPV